MALQIEVSKVSVSDVGKQYSGKLLIGTARLKCWAEGDNPTTDSPVINRNVSAPYKSIDGMTVDEQLTRWAVLIKSQMQDSIDAYLVEQLLLTNAKLDTAVTSIQGALTS